MDDRRQTAAISLTAMVLSLVLLCALSTSAHAQKPAPPLSDEVRFEPRLNAQLPSELTFRDETGKQIALGDYFGSKPIILTLNYLHCPNLCPLILDDLERTLADLQLDLGHDYDVITVSIDPRETPVVAAVKKQELVGRYGRAGAEEGWHFLTGAENSIEQLAQVVGFDYAYDAKRDEYAHPAGIVVLTPQGKISRYLYGMDFAPTDVRLALVESSQDKIGSLADQVLLVCYHYDPETGKYTNLAMDFVRWGGVASLFLLGGFLFVLWKREFAK